MFDPDLRIGEELAAWGKVLLMETRGRRSGVARRVAVGFVDQPDGVRWIAAAGERTNWALNLLAEPRCRVSVAGETRECVAHPLQAAERSLAVTKLILKYGTPAERLGAGPAFALIPVGAEDGPAEAP